MANFAATFKNDDNIIDISGNGNIIAIYDHSNYDTNTDSGHTQADFSDFKKIKITNPDGTTYIYSSLGDGDESIVPAATAPTLHILTNYDYDTGDGVYRFCLLTVPTWDSVATYSLAGNMCVFYDDKLYKALKDSTNVIPDSDPTTWEEIDEDDLPTRYRNCQRVAIYCDAISCLMQYVKETLCGVDALHCTDDICKNVAFQRMTKLFIATEGIPVLVNDGDWGGVTNLINLTKQICCCI